MNKIKIQHLVAEIAKINEQIIECYQSFDSQLLSLHQRKVKTQQAIYQVSSTNETFLLSILAKANIFFIRKN